MKAAQWIFLLLSVMSAGARDAYEFPIRRSRVLSTWQSSFGDGPTCFYNRNQSAEESVLNSESSSHRFFHSADKSEADGGFHWFAVQLNETVLIRSVTVKGREDGSLSQRARHIEIWTTGRSRAVFSSEHCSSQLMSRQFNETFEHWKLCGTTSESDQMKVFTVDCITEVRQLLLRRDMLKYDGYMNFVDLILQTAQLEFRRPALVAEGSNLEVRCYLSYKGSELSTVSNQLQLCLPNDSCIAGQELNVVSAQPQHSGIYTCRFGAVNNSTIVKVLSASPSEYVAENSNFTVNCSVHCGMEKNCTAAAGLQLCLPNSTCLPEARLTSSARPGSSGVYTCKAGEVSKITMLAVLSSSPDQKVAENSSFTVGCGLNYTSSDLSSLLSKMKLCTPAGNCSANHSVKIAMANPAHSGIYTCQIDSTRKQARVSVLHPPSSLSISMLHWVSCSSESELIIKFESSASEPVPEHRCSAAAGGIVVRNETLPSEPEGHVSRWTLLVWNRSITVSCTAEQTLPVGISFEASSTVTEAFSCTEIQMPTGLTGFMQYVAASLIGAFVTALVASAAVGLAIRLTSKRDTETSVEAVELKLVVAESSGMQHNDGSEAEAGPSRGVPDSDCSYLTVRPPAAKPATEHPDDRSDCTEFLEIVADGD